LKDYCREVDIKEMQWQIFGRISVTEDTVEFFDVDGNPAFLMHHEQDCCESVYLEDVIGDWNDLVNTPIFVAECVTSRNRPEDDDDYWSAPESETWTFYKFTTIKGHVTLRWYGSSNGYYSEAVSIMKYAESEDMKGL
jgi:hypothetical protein